MEVPAAVAQNGVSPQVENSHMPLPTRSGLMRPSSVGPQLLNSVMLTAAGPDIGE